MTDTAAFVLSAENEHVQKKRLTTYRTTPRQLHGRRRPTVGPRVGPLAETRQAHHGPGARPGAVRGGRPRAPRSQARGDAAACSVSFTTSCRRQRRGHGSVHGPCGRQVVLGPDYLLRSPQVLWCWSALRVSMTYATFKHVWFRFPWSRCRHALHASQEEVLALRERLDATHARCV